MSEKKIEKSMPKFELIVLFENIDYIIKLVTDYFYDHEKIIKFLFCNDRLSDTDIKYVNVKL